MNTEMRRAAINRIRARQQFYLHLGFYVVMSFFLLTLWARSDADFFWPGFAVVGWGIGIVAHGSQVFGWQRPISEERIQKEIDALS